VVALRPELLGQQLAVRGRALPVHRAPVHAGHELEQVVEFRPFAALALDLHAVHGVAGEQAQRLLAYPLQVRRNRHRAVQRFRPLLPRQAHRPAPARPQPLDPALAAPLRPELEAGAPPRRPPRRR
jgi:hypothetical protein